VRRAITTAPAYASQVLSNVLTGVVAIPLRDADPSTITLVGHGETSNPYAAAMRAFATGFVDSGSGP
jgi:nitrogenase subunit NifH